MAELVDALVSNTNGVKPVPVRSRLRAQRKFPNRFFQRFGIFIISFLSANCLLVEKDQWKYFGIHWPSLDEDLSFEGIYKKTENLVENI